MVGLLTRAISELDGSFAVNQFAHAVAEAYEAYTMVDEDWDEDNELSNSNASVREN